MMSLDTVLLYWICVPESFFRLPTRPEYPSCCEANNWVTANKNSYNYQVTDLTCVCRIVILPELHWFGMLFNIRRLDLHYPQTLQETRFQVSHKVTTIWEWTLMKSSINSLSLEFMEHGSDEYVHISLSFLTWASVSFLFRLLSSAPSLNVNGCFHAWIWAQWT